MSNERSLFFPLLLRYLFFPNYTFFDSASFLLFHVNTDTFVVDHRYFISFWSKRRNKAKRTHGLQICLISSAHHIHQLETRLEQKTECSLDRLRTSSMDLWAIPCASNRKRTDFSYLILLFNWEILACCAVWTSIQCLIHFSKFSFTPINRRLKTKTMLWLSSHTGVSSLTVSNACKAIKCVDHHR